MTIEQIRNDMIQAMKAKDTVKKNTLSSLLSCITNIAIAKKCKDNITEEIVTEAIMKEIKTIKEQIDTCPADRQTLLAEYAAGLKTLEAYAPKQLSEEEIIEILNTKFADVTATKNKGQIMKAIMPEFKGKADGKLINKIVTDICK